MHVDIRPLVDAAEWVEFAQVSLDTFGGDEPAEARAERWRLGFGAPSLGLAVVDGPRIVGGVVASPVEQYIGGVPTPTGASYATCLLPEYRRARVGGALMRRLLEGMRAGGMPIITGWPSTNSFYRRFGCEVLGREVTHRVDAAALLGLSAPGELERDPLAGRRAEAIALQRRCAAGWNGPFHRSEVWWDRLHPVRTTRDQQRYGWVEDGVLTGLLIARRLPQRRLEVTDLWTTTPNALLGLLGFLGAQESVIDHVDFAPSAQPPADEVSAVLSRPKMVLQAGLAWQLGLIDVPVALATRGYPGTLSARLELEVLARPEGADPLLLVLEVEQGRPTVSRGGSGALRIHQSALTGWYGGALAASRAALLGLAHGTPEDIETLGLLGGDRVPWLPEHN